MTQNSTRARRCCLKGGNARGSDNADPPRRSTHPTSRTVAVQQLVNQCPHGINTGITGTDNRHIQTGRCAFQRIAAPCLFLAKREICPRDMRRGASQNIDIQPIANQFIRCLHPFCRFRRAPLGLAGANADQHHPAGFASGQGAD